MDLRFVRQRFEKLSGREKVIGAFTLFILVFITPYMFFYSPSEKTVKSRRQSLDAIEKEARTLETLIAEQARRQVVAVPEPVKLPEADDLHGIFLSISGKASELGVDFISIAPESVSPKQGFTEMRLKLELRLKYRELYDFIRFMSQNHRLFMVESVRFETNDALYPSGVALIRAVTYLKKT